MPKICRKIYLKICRICKTICVISREYDKYAFSMSSAFCLDLHDVTESLQLVVMQVCSRARGQSQRPLTDTAGPQLPEACRLMTWVRSCQATGNNNPSTSFSAIAKKLKKSMVIAGLADLKFKLTLQRICFGTPLHNNEGGESGQARGPCRDPKAHKPRACQHCQVSRA